MAFNCLNFFESTSPFKVLVSDVNLHPYTSGDGTEVGSGQIAGLTGEEMRNVLNRYFTEVSRCKLDPSSKSKQAPRRFSTTFDGGEIKDKQRFQLETWFVLSMCHSLRRGDRDHRGARRRRPQVCRGRPVIHVAGDAQRSRHTRGRRRLGRGNHPRDTVRPSHPGKTVQVDIRLTLG